MICPLLSYQSRFDQCQAGRCAWWDTMRQCCGVVRMNFGHYAIQAAKARLDSDVELSGGQA